MQHGFEEAAAFRLGGGELRFQPVAEGHQLIHFCNDAVLFGERWKWDQNRAQNFKVDVFLRCGWSEYKQVRFGRPKEILKILGVGKFRGRYKADYTVWKTCVEAQDATVSDVRCDGDTHSSLGPPGTLSESNFVVFARIGFNETLGASDIAGLDEQVSPAIEQGAVVSGTVL